MKTCFSKNCYKNTKTCFFTYGCDQRRYQLSQTAIYCTWRRTITICDILL